MTGHRPNWYFLATWVFVSPAVCLGIFLFSVMSLVYAEPNVYPWWGELLGFHGVDSVLCCLFHASHTRFSEGHE
ncbi:sodium- and chloride-dependent creatine transporter 1-like [Tachypleus tridentatus]|uniref:sodium- and chloride-dependent creatine transporter 1-like n=1 Tax=Tachypleus tridentatus TaxID=6853 RepID=UPI003FCF7A94